MNLTDKQRDILKKIISNLGDENYRNMDKDWFDYDHNSFIKSILVRDGERLDEMEPTDIQSITMEILQIEKLGHIKHYDKNGDDLRKDPIIEEDTTSYKDTKGSSSNSPFRYKKIGKNKYKYDFVSWDEWEKLMRKKNETKSKSVKHKKPIRRK